MIGEDQFCIDGGGLGAIDWPPGIDTVPLVIDPDWSPIWFGDGGSFGI